MRRLVQFPVEVYTLRRTLKKFFYMLISQAVLEEVFATSLQAGADATRVHIFLKRLFENFISIPFFGWIRWSSLAAL
jgi:hypothetical protein